MRGDRKITRRHRMEKPLGDDRPAYFSTSTRPNTITRNDLVYPCGILFVMLQPAETLWIRDPGRYHFFSSSGRSSLAVGSWPLGTLRHMNRFRRDLKWLFHLKLYLPSYSSQDFHRGNDVRVDIAYSRCHDMPDPSCATTVWQNTPSEYLLI